MGDKSVQFLRDRFDRCVHLAHAIATQLYYGRGAFDAGSKDGSRKLTLSQRRRFWQDAAPLFADLALERHPDTAYHVVQTLHHVLSLAPREAFLLAAKAILSSSPAGFHFESLAVEEVVRLVQQALADHRGIFRTENDRESDCLKALLEVLDLFVDAGWSEARQLTHKLEEIYR